jgi:hypothetical protein
VNLTSELFGNSLTPIGDVGRCKNTAIAPGERCPRDESETTPDGKAEVVVGALREDLPLVNPNPAFGDAGASFLVDGATGTVLATYEHPEPQMGAVFGSQVSQLAAGDLGLRGGEGNDRLAGGPGRDTLYGNGGADSLDTQDARRGNDVARGGAGAPTRARPIPATFVAPAEALGAWVANATGRGIIAVGGESRGHGADRRSDGRFASVGLPPASGAPLRRSACRQNPRPPARCSLSRLWAQLRRH